MKYKIIAVDFDGALCENKYPDIGKPNFTLIDYLKHQQALRDVRIVLWTCRVGDELGDAIRWCHEHGLEFDEVNKNIPEIIEAFETDTRKFGIKLVLNSIG